MGIISPNSKRGTREKAVEKAVEKTVEKILVFIRQTPRITQAQLQAKSGLTRRGVEWNLRKLKASGLIRRIGPDKGGHWHVLSRPGEAK